jgi:hypothetical protein
MISRVPVRRAPDMRALGGMAGSIVIDGVRRRSGIIRRRVRLRHDLMGRPGRRFQTIVRTQREQRVGRPGLVLESAKSKLPKLLIDREA